MNRPRSSRLSKGSTDGDDVQMTEDLKASITQLEDEINDHVNMEDHQPGITVAVTKQLSEKELLLIDTNKKIDDRTARKDTVTANKLKICLFTDSVTANLLPDIIIPEGLNTVQSKLSKRAPLIMLKCISV